MLAGLNPEMSERDHTDRMTIPRMYAGWLLNPGRVLVVRADGIEGYGVVGTARCGPGRHEMVRRDRAWRANGVAGMLLTGALVGCASTGGGDAASEPAAATTSAEPISVTPSDPDRPWTVPVGWTEDPAPRQMRLATYTASDPSGPHEVAVTRFGGRVGGDLANVTRWRRQMGLGPVAEADLDAILDRFTAPGYEGYRLRLESERGVMLVVAMYEVSEDRTWFVRSTLPDAAAADRLQPDLFAMGASIAGAR